MHFLPGKRAAVVFLAVAAVMLLPLAAFATSTYTLITGNFSAPPDGPYGTVKVDLTPIATVDGDPITPGIQPVTGATITLTAALAPTGYTGYNGSPYFTFFDTNAFNFNTAVPVTVFHTSTNGTDLLVAGGSGNVDGFGVFNQTFNVKDGPSSGFTTASVIVYASNLSSFSSDGSVLAENHFKGSNTPAGCFVSAHIFWTGLDVKSTNFVSDRSPDFVVPVPASALLLGSGLLGLGLIGWRRREKEA